MISVCFQGQPFNSTVNQVYAATSNGEEIEVEWLYEDLQDLLELTFKNDVLFIIGDWNAKEESHEIPGLTGKFGLGVQHEEAQRLSEVCQENALVIVNTVFQQHKEDSTNRHNQMSNTKVRLRISFQRAKDGEALKSHQKQDWQLTVAQIMNTLLQNSDLNWRK